MRNSMIWGARERSLFIAIIKDWLISLGELQCVPDVSVKFPAPTGGIHLALPLFGTNLGEESTVSN